MKKKLLEILNLPQFEKVTNQRKNAKDCVIKEEERIIDAPKELKNKGKIDEHLYYCLKPIGSQPPRLYGQAKIHKTSIPLRPVLSMPGSAYHKIAQKVSEWLEVVPEAQINSSSKKISDQLKTIQLDDDEVIVSFDVSALYTNVPVKEAIQKTADRLYRGDLKLPPVDKDTFIQLIELASLNVIMSTHDGYYKQVDGLAMGSPPASQLANVWINGHEPTIKDDAKLYERYMDDILRSIKKSLIEYKLQEINSIHPNLKFTIELEQQNQLPFLDMCIIHEGNNLHSTWYTKPTDTGLTMNFHALAPRKYKRAVIQGFVHRIYRACSEWKYFDESLRRAKLSLERNQYPPEFYDPIIAATIEKLVAPLTPPEPEPPPRLEGNTTPSFQMVLQFRGRMTENVVRKLNRLHNPVKAIITLRKLKTVLPSLKPKVPKGLRSHIVYHITCPGCAASYVGQTARHHQIRLAEHRNKNQPVGGHFHNCVYIRPELEDTQILGSTTRGIEFLETLEALFINEHKPILNSKDEYRSRTLTLKF